MTIETQTKVIVAEVEPEAVKEVVETQVPGLQGPQGEKGKTGTTFTPTVTKDGWVMWTNDGGAKNPSPVCIMGPKGDEGKRGERGEQGEKGETGTFNPDDLKVLQEAKASAEASATTATEQAGIATEKAEALTEAVDNLTTLSNDAVRFTAQEKTDAEKYRARKNIAASSAGEVDALKKQVANLQAQAEGKTFTYETDATEAYSKDVPEGAYPYAAVKNFGGKTIVWNQQIPNERISFSQTNASSIQEGASAYWQINVSTQPVKGHQYYIYFNAVGTTDNFKSASVFYGSANSVQSGNGKVITAENSLNIFRCICEGAIGDFVGCSVSNLNIFDLTKMFGAGNEPTAEEFLQMLPENYYEYNEGELKSAPVNNLKIRGQNILPTDLEFTQGSTSISVTRHDDGSITLNGMASADSSMRGSLPEVEGNYQGKSLTLSSGNPLPTGVWLSWGNGAPMIAGNDSRTSTLAVGAVGDVGNCFYLYVKSGVTFNKLRIYPMLTAHREEKEYKPYSLKVRQVPQAILDLEGYGWSAGTAKNWVDWEKKEYHREVASFDLGSKGWWIIPATETSKARFLTVVNTLKSATDVTVLPNILCSRYQSAQWKEIVPINGSDKIIGNILSGSDSCIGVVDSTYSDAGAFRESLKGVLLYYELAEPEIIDISNILPDDNLIEVEEGGTITFENSNGDGFRIPVPSEIVYQKKVTTNE